jgi:hypothetical protein
MSRVFIFNAAPTACFMIVNNGSNRFTVPSCDADTTWAPGVPATADMPDFTGADAGNPGEFKVGPNSVNITPVSGGGSFTTTIQIPTTINPRSTLQLYIFWETTGTVSWTLLSDGQPVAGTTAM